MLVEVNTLVKAMNGDNDAQTLLSKTFLSFDLEETKDLLKKIEKDLKNTRKNGMRKVRLSPNLTSAELAFDFLQLTNDYVNYKMEKERVRAWDYLNNDEEAEKHGYINENDFREGGKYWDLENNRPSKKMPKANEQMMIKWADNAYANLTVELWEAEFDVMLLKAHLKNF